MVAVKEVALVPADQSKALSAIAGGAAEIARVIVDAAANPQIDAAKIAALVGMQEHLQNREAVAAFHVAFALMAQDIPEIDERGAIKNSAGKVQSQYAKFEDIKRVITPILARHGFAMSYETDPHSADDLTVVGILTHVGGHERKSRFRSKADTSGSKNAVQGLGSIVTYGKRYTTCDLLNITTREQDNDGQSQKPEPPPNYDDLMAAFDDSASQGYPASRKFFAGLPEAVRNYALKYAPARLAEIKAKAQKVAK